jgi:DNA repair ATPase RecN
MTNKKVKWEEMIANFDQIEKKFAKNTTDSSLMEFLETFEQTIADSDFNQQQLAQIKERMQKLQGLFSKRLDEIKGESSEAITRSEQVSRYVKNANYKKPL